MANVELTLPGSVLVDARGRRFVNEATNYHDLNKAFRTIDPAHRHARPHPGLDGGRQRLRRPVLHRRHPGRYRHRPGRSGVRPSPSCAAVRHRPRRAGRDARRVQPARRAGPRPALPPRPECAGPPPRRRHPSAPVPRAARAGPLPRDPDPPGHARHVRRARHRRRRPVLDRHGRPITGLYAAGNVSAARVRRRLPRWGCDPGVRDHAGLRRRARARPHLTPDTTKEGPPCPCSPSSTATPTTPPRSTSTARGTATTCAGCTRRGAWSSAARWPKAAAPAPC